VASSEREHAAEVAAAEEEASRRVKERKTTRRPEDGGRNRQSVRRTAERALAEAEQRVEDRERRVAELGAQLEDPALYLAPGGAERAHRLGAELEAARVELETAFAQWESATRALEASG
jgi:exonuclease VII small subunit